MSIEFDPHVSPNQIRSIYEVLQRIIDVFENREKEYSKDDFLRFIDASIKEIGEQIMIFERSASNSKMNLYRVEIYKKCVDYLRKLRGAKLRDAFSSVYLSIDAILLRPDQALLNRWKEKYQEWWSKHMMAGAEVVELQDQYIRIGNTLWQRHDAYSNSVGNPSFERHTDSANNTFVSHKTANKLTIGTPFSVPTENQFSVALQLMPGFSSHEKGYNLFSLLNLNFLGRKKSSNAKDSHYLNFGKGTTAFYWTATTSGSDEAYAVCFDKNGEFKTILLPKSRLLPVRLVHQLQADAN